MQLNTLNKHMAQIFRQPERKPLPNLPAPKAKAIASNIMLKQPQAGRDEMALLLLRAHFQKNRLDITSTGEPHSKQEIAEFHAISEQILHDLYHGQNLLHALAHAEMRTHLLKITLALYCDWDEHFDAAHQIFEDARNALSDYNDKPNPNPEINRKKLDMLAFWFELTEKYAAFVPKQAFVEASYYNTGIQIIHYYGRLMTHDANEVAVAFRVIRGASLESTATKHQIRQSKLRETALHIGQMLYRIGMVTEEHGNIDVADSIPKLRTPEYIALTDLSNLKDLLARAKNEYCQPFERAFGISQVDWDKLHHNITHGQIQIAKKLNCE